MYIWEIEFQFLFCFKLLPPRINPIYYYYYYFNINFVFEAIPPLYRNRLNAPSWITPQRRLYTCIIVINRRNVSFVFTAVRQSTGTSRISFYCYYVYYNIFVCTYRIFYYNITCDSDEGPAANEARNERPEQVRRDTSI